MVRLGFDSCCLGFPSVPVGNLRAGAFPSCLVLQCASRTVVLLLDLWV